MEKPITIATQEFIDKAINLIQTCGLPAFVIRYVFKDLLDEINGQMNVQYEEDLKKWNDFQKEEVKK